MNEELKGRLMSEFGLAEADIEKLTVQGVKSAEDLQMLTEAELKDAGCTLIAAKKIRKAFAPVAVAASGAGGGEVGPDGATEPKPTAAEVTTFASSMGIDPSFLTTFLMANVAGGAGIDMDLSGMLPIPQIVGGYNPKIRNIPFMIMGQLETRLGTPIVVINHNGSVNQDLTVKYVMSLEEGFPPPDDGVFFDPDTSTPYEIIRVGVDAQSIYDADPLDSTRAIPMSHMGIGRINWKDVSLEVRQTVYYAATRTGEIDPTNDAHCAWLRDHVNPSATRLSLRGQCPKALSEYNEALRTGSLPTLRVMLTRGPRKKEVMPRRRPGAPRDLSGIGLGREGRPGGDEPFRS